MKKIFFYAMLMLCLNANADNNDMNMLQMQKTHIEVNTKSLARALDTNTDQNDAIVTLIDIFDKQTKCASAEENAEVRNRMLMNAINENLRLMNGILTKEQMKKYKTYLNITLQNRGLVLAD